MNLAEFVHFVNEIYFLQSALGRFHIWLVGQLTKGPGDIEGWSEVD